MHWWDVSRGGGFLFPSHHFGRRGSHPKPFWIGSSSKSTRNWGVYHDFPWIIFVPYPVRHGGYVCSFKFMTIHDHLRWLVFSKKMSSRRSMQFWSTVSAPYKKRKHIPNNKSIIWIIFPDRLYNHTILWISVNICTWRKTCHGQLPLCRWFIYST